MRDLIDNTGTNRNRIRYDSFGNLTNQTNPTLTFRFGYTGRDFDSETGLSYYRARYYDARVGRFLSEDPIGFAGGDANLYRYVGNSPANYTDPTGNIAWGVVVGAGVLAPIVADLFFPDPGQTPTDCNDVENSLNWLWRAGVEIGLGAAPEGIRGGINLLDDLAGAIDNVGSSLNDWFGQGPTLAPAGGGSLGRGGAIGSGGLDDSFRQPFAMQGGDVGGLGSAISSSSNNTLGSGTRFTSIASNMSRNSARDILRGASTNSQLTEAQISSILNKLGKGKVDSVSIKSVNADRSVRLTLERAGRVSGFQRMTYEIAPDGSTTRLVQTAFDDVGGLVRQRPGSPKNNLFDVKR